MVEAIKQFFTDTFTNPYVATILIAMIPVVELRGAIPYMYFARLSSRGFAGISKAFLTAFIGSSLVVPILLLLLLPTINWLKKRKIFRRMAEWVERHFVKKSQKLEQKIAKKEGEETVDVEAKQVDEQALLRKKKRIERAKYLGVFAFTAIPLPLTGVWSASAVAAFLKLDFKKSAFWIILGNLVAGIIVSLICLFTNWMI